MNINNPTTFSTPDLTLSTSNSSGTAGALRADDTILVYDTTVPTTIASSASAAAGDTGTAARRNHTHGAPALGDIVGPGSSVDNELARFNGTTGKLLQAYTGTGPTADDNGILTLTGQPAMLVHLSATISNVTGGGTEYTVFAASDPVTVTEVFDIGADFAAPTYTAPSTGKYFIQTEVRCSGVTSSETRAILRIKTSDEVFTSTPGSPAAQDSSGEWACNASAIASLTASDTVTITLAISGGSDVVDLFGTSYPSTWWSICKVA